MAKDRNRIRQAIDQAAPYFEGAGIPENQMQSVFQALDAAGLAVVTKAADSPVQVLDDVPCEKLKAVGMRGVFLVKIRVNSLGCMVCVESSDDRGGIVRSAWSYAPDPE
jgi:hypothetical protein